MMRWVEHVARTGVMRRLYMILVTKSEEKVHLEDLGLGLDGKIILRCIWKKYVQ